MQTTNDVQRLTPEVQQAMAKVELARVSRHLRLLRRARTYPGRRWLSLICLILCCWVTVANLQFPATLPVLVILAISFIVVHVHAQGVNQRLDALLEMLPEELSAATEKEEQKA